MLDGATKEPDTARNARETKIARTTRKGGAVATRGSHHKTMMSMKTIETSASAAAPRRFERRWGTIPHHESSDSAPLFETNTNDRIVRRRVEKPDGSKEPSLLRKPRERATAPRTRRDPRA